MSYRWLIVAWLTAAIAAASVMFSCSPDNGGNKSVTQIPEATDVIDQDLIIPLAQAKNFHRKAKVYMSDGNLPAAIASVRQILSLRFPPNAPEAEDVRNDARALLAKLLVGQNQLDEAMRVVDEGIAQSSRKSFFVANLYTVKGEVHDALATQAAADNDAAKAKEQRHLAIEALDKSIAINSEIQKQLMENR
jgi:tetratricopeptide (TPR) repeat protein